ncbi:nicotinate phosphoribosyltransferase [Angomonas deanei]|nr:nicotinate phosphoribosyltransferase [Angomonas deanei]EPY27329.1 nicotinate phosphoribosyltransferase [Angomonas deanei]|eukprot:EPY27046.1 nicotinate phosphoribosyltransferase [Angomonas deanei]
MYNSNSAKKVNHPALISCFHHSILYFERARGILFSLSRSIHSFPKVYSVTYTKQSKPVLFSHTLTESKSNIFFIISLSHFYRLIKTAVHLYTRTQKLFITMSSEPIITSFLDTDAYKLHMQQAVFHSYRDVVASFEFNCRNKDDYLGVYADEIQEQVNKMRDVFLTKEEYTYLLTLPHFKKDYIEYLKDYRYKPEQVQVTRIPPVLEPESAKFGEDGSKLRISVSGPWVETILWEIPLLAIVSEVAQRRRHPECGVKQAMDSLNTKLEKFFAAHDEEELKHFKVSDFGTRRRFSKAVQEAVVTTLANHPRFKHILVGSSNYDIARRLGIPAVGTQAHEWFQAFQQLSPELSLSQTEALKAWLHEYPFSLGIALTDCITMDAFLNDFNADLANAYQGLRQDSGDPVRWGQKALAHYKRLGIDAKKKVLVFSDGLNLETAVELYNRFKDEVNVMCGIGTQLTCAIDGIRAMNIVLKMVRCQGKPVAKISDSTGKVMCEDDEFVEQLCNAFNVASPVTRATTIRQIPVASP